jgi:hypothetical protein
MKRTRISTRQSNLVNLRQARWLVGVLGLLVAVVGKETLLGLILGQARVEIGSLIQHSEAEQASFAENCYLNN